MNKIKTLAVLPPLITVVILPMTVAAQVAPLEPITTVAGIETILENVLGWLNVFFYIIATIFIILAAFKYLTAQGDQEKVKAAKSMLIYAIVAIVIALVAGGVANIIGNLIGGGAAPPA